jgi:hypothetical protein
VAHQTAMQSGVAAFIQAVLERHNGRQMHWPSLDLVLRRRPSGMTMRPIYHQVQMHVAPRLNLTVAGATTLLHKRSIERVERTLREQLVHYLGMRGTRIDAVATQGSLTASAFNKASSPGSRTRIEAVATQRSLTASDLEKAPSPGTNADFPLARPVPRVVRRPTPASGPDDLRLTAETPMTRPGPRPVVASRTNSAAPSPIDVNRLTDQVIQTIDRRIVAQRERLGRV